MFSGFVAVLAVANQRSSLPTTETFVLVHLKTTFKSGLFDCHFETSAHSTSLSCCLVGAVATTLEYGKHERNHKHKTASQPVFPTP